MLSKTPSQYKARAREILCERLPQTCGLYVLNSNTIGMNRSFGDYKADFYATVNCTVA